MFVGRLVGLAPPHSLGRSVGTSVVLVSSISSVARIPPLPSLSVPTLVLTVEASEAVPAMARSRKGSTGRVRAWVLTTAVWSSCTGLR